MLLSPARILLDSWPGRVDRFMWRDGCVNVLLYFPLGLSATMAAALRAPRVVAVVGAVLLGGSLSACMEMLQIFDRSRTCSLLDVACNLAGAAAGAIAAVIFERQIRNVGGAKRISPPARGAPLLPPC